MTTHCCVNYPCPICHASAIQAAYDDRRENEMSSAIQQEEILDALEEFVIYDHDSDPYFTELQKNGLTILHKHGRLTGVSIED